MSDELIPECEERPPSMPPEIAKAIVAIMSGVKKLAKDGDNKFAKYKFTSVDQFYEALGPLMAAQGLFDIAVERSTSVETRETVDDFGKVKKAAWLTAEYDFWLFHEGGARFGPLARSIQVQATGAQSYASAQSYLEKYFLRNLFKIPTGDVDEIDSARPDALPEKTRAPASSEQTAVLIAEMKRAGRGWKRILAHYGARTHVDLTAEQVLDAIEILKMAPDAPEASEKPETAAAPQ